MFYECKNLSDLDLSHFNTKNILNLYGMFKGSEKLLKSNISLFENFDYDDIIGI